MKVWYRCAYCGKKLALIEMHDNKIDGITLICGRCKKINKISIEKPLTKAIRK